ncbi:hypothetical protein M0804_003537 [Polistes exclamans]|nr:hypothetical protein M0804_003537 [Polistes exclamans]
MRRDVKRICEAIRGSTFLASICSSSSSSSSGSSGSRGKRTMKQKLHVARGGSYYLSSQHNTSKRRFETQSSSS